MDDRMTKQEKRKQNLRFAGRLGLILFIGLSIYLFISSIILILLTKPGKEIEIPYVTGKRFIEVYNSLTRKGLIPEIEFYYVFDMDNGVILNQYPEKGTIVSEGEKIKLIVSRSEVYLPVPNLIGTKLPFAINKLKNLHLNGRSYSISIGTISYIPSKYAESVILDHSPDAREEITPDRKINLLVSAGKVSNGMKMPLVKGQSIELGFDLLLSKGTNIYEEIVLTEFASKSGLIESQSPAPDEDININGLVKLKVLFYSQKERQYASYERITYTIPSDEKEGLFEAYVEDNRSKRIRFSRKMKPGWIIDFVFKRRGNAKIRIMNNKKTIETISINPDEFS